ncbi:MAG: hypothetical protein ACYCST_20450, partial [Acidimicrobiales bacterium]
RDAAGIERRLRQARFEQACAIEDFDFSFNAKVPAAQMLAATPSARHSATLADHAPAAFVGHGGDLARLSTLSPA